MPEFELPIYDQDASGGSSTPPPALPRIPWAWWLLLLVFGFLITTSFIGSASGKKAKSAISKAEESTLELKFAAQGLGATGKPSVKDAFSEEIEGLLAEVKRNPDARQKRIVLRVADGEKPFGDDLTELAKSTRPQDKAFSKLFSEPKPNKADSEPLLKTIGTKDFSARAATVLTKERFGDKSIRTKLFNVSGAVKFGALAMLLCLGTVAGAALHLFYWSQRSSGKLVPKGFPTGTISMAVADRLALAGALSMAAYVVGGIFVELIRVSALVYLPVFAMLVFLLRKPIFGMPLSAKAVGLEFADMGKKTGWAFGAVVGNIPIMMIAIMVMAALKNFLPGGGHPASDILTNNPTPMVVFTMFMLGCVVAPIWEEIVFRGFLFPAIAKVSNSPILGALGSSFLFAAIHPQGVLGTLPLMMLACMFCFLTYQTKSLVPGMLAHAINNFVILSLNLLLGDVLK